MGQYWNVFDLDGETHVADLRKLGERLFETHGHAFVLLLARPVPFQQPSRTDLIKPYQRSSKGLFKLPIELLDIILLEVWLLDDLLAFVMANKTLYTIGFKHFQDALCRYTVPSAGHRLICLGDNTDDDDLPPGILPKDLEKAAAWRESSNFPDSTFGTYAIETFRRASVFLYDDLSWLRLWGKRFPDGRRSWSSSYLYEAEALSELLERHYPSDLDWVLCNLTKRVYVTTDAISEFTRERPRGPFFYARIGFGEVLLCQICWSSSEETHLVYDGPIHRGKWVTDRFTITTMDRMSELEPVEGGGDGEWEDVSNEVVGEMAAIFRADFGKHYKQYFARPRDPWPCEDEAPVYDPYDFITAGRLR